MARTKAPVEGVVSYVSKNGTEVHLQGDPRRYRGYARRESAARKNGGRTAPVFKWHHVKVGDRVRLFWGGFADLNIVRVQKLDPQPPAPKPTYTTSLPQAAARVAVEWGLLTLNHTRDCACLTCEEIRMLVS